jgi:adenylate cyclase
MQKAMGGVNEQNVRRGWPEIEMGIALHTGEVVVGNIGSVKRSKYGVVGRTINTTARIESFTVGGQVIVSPTLIQAAVGGLILGDEVEVHAKGMKEPLRCRQLLGYEGHPELELGEEVPCTPLPQALPVRYVLLTGKHFNERMEPARLVAVSDRQAVLEACGTVAVHSNLLLRLESIPGEVEAPEFYAKVLRVVPETPNLCVIHFTSIPPVVRARLTRLIDPSAPTDGQRVLI